jgi:hypothetical protein
LSRTATDRFLLRSLHDRELHLESLEPTEWEALWVKARTHCLTPYLEERWRRAGILERIPESVAQRFTAARRLNLERNRRLAAHLGEAAATLESAGVPALAVKGLHLAKRCYGDLGLRVLYDLDLVIRPADRVRALQALSGLGYVPFDGRSDQGADLLWRPREYRWDAEGVFDPERPVLIDLQTRLWPSGWHGFRVGSALDAWADHRWADLGAARLRVPSDEKLMVELTVHYAFNALEAHARLMHLVDVALLVAAAAATLEWERFLAEADRSRVGRFCFLTFELARAVCDCRIPDEIRGRLQRETPRAALRWLERSAAAAPLAMDLYARDRSAIYALHWAMASGWGERTEVLGYSLAEPWREAGRARRYGPFARRMAARLAELARSAARPRG